MIRLRDLLLELDYGDKLFADDLIDPKHPREKAWGRFIQQIYRPDFEPNTGAEQELLDQLQAYIGVGHRNAKLASALQQLLPLRSRFPRILDPTAASITSDDETPMPWAEPYPDLAWRGTWAPMPWAAKVMAQSKHVHNVTVSDEYSLRHVMFRDGREVEATVFERPGVIYKSSGERMISFSDRPDVAFRFMRARAKDIYNPSKPSGVPVALGIAKTHPRLIMNPDAMNALGSDFAGGESEMLLLTNAFTPDVVVFIDPYGLKYIDNYIDNIQ